MPLPALLSNLTPTDALALIENQEPPGLPLPSRRRSSRRHSPTLRIRRSSASQAKVSTRVASVDQSSRKTPRAARLSLPVERFGHTNFATVGPRRSLQIVLASNRPFSAPEAAVPVKAIGF